MPWPHKNRPRKGRRKVGSTKRRARRLSRLRKKGYGMGALIVFLMFVGAGEQMADMQVELDGANAKISNLTAQVQGLSSSHDALSATVGNLETKVGGLETRVDGIADTMHIHNE